MAAHLAAFLGVSAVVIVTPGPDTALTIRNSLFGGRRGGTLTALGVATGQATWALAASVGLAALLHASEPAFLALRILGGVYLVFLGAQALLAAAHGRARRPQGLCSRSRHAAFCQGLLSNLSNPKMAVFFTSLLPQFVSSFTGLLALGLLFSALTLTWLSCYAVVVARAGDVLRRSPLRRVLDALTGAVLVALGVRLASERG